MTIHNAMMMGQGWGWNMPNSRVHVANFLTGEEDFLM